MPRLVEKRVGGSKDGVWEVKWTWLPTFLAQDANLVREVDARLGQLFVGGSPPLPGVLDKALIDTICVKYPMTGLREAIEAVLKIDPTLKLHIVDKVLPEDSVRVTQEGSYET